MRRILDRSKPYEQVYPPGRIWYVQGGIPFDFEGREVTDEGAAKPAETVGLTESEALPTDNAGASAGTDLARMPWVALRKLAAGHGVVDIGRKTRDELIVELREKGVVG